jgi:hypothetical protein
MRGDRLFGLKGETRADAHTKNEAKDAGTWRVGKLLSSLQSTVVQIWVNA